MIGPSPSFTQTVFVYLCICVFVFVYLVIQYSSQTNWNFLLPVRFLQLFCWGTLNGLKSVESIFPLSRSYFIFLRQTAVCYDYTTLVTPELRQALGYVPSPQGVSFGYVPSPVLALVWWSS